MFWKIKYIFSRLIKENKKKKLFFNTLQNEEIRDVYFYVKKSLFCLKVFIYSISFFFVIWSFVQSFAEPYTNYSQLPGSGLEFGFLPGKNGTGDYRYDLSSLELNPLKFHAFYSPTLKYGPFLSWFVYPFGWIFINLIYCFGKASAFLESSGLHIIFSMLIVMVVMRFITFFTTFRTAYYAEKQLLHKSYYDKINKKYDSYSITDKTMKSKKQQELASYNKKHGLKPMVAFENFFINTPIFLIVFKLVTITRPLKFATIFGVWEMAKTPSYMIFNRLLDGGWAYLLLCIVIIPTNFLSQYFPNKLTQLRNPHMKKGEIKDPQQQNTKKIQNVMTLMFLLFTFFWSTGLAIYYFFNSLFTIIQTVLIHFLLIKYRGKKNTFKNQLKKLGIDQID